jgi:hypothetical protein
MHEGEPKRRLIPVESRLKRRYISFLYKYTVRLVKPCMRTEHGYNNKRLNHVEDIIYVLFFLNFDAVKSNSIL